MIKKLYFCENCRESIDDVSKIHFVEDNSDRGFCSEKCILDFYRPYMEALEQEEDFLRASLSLPADEGHHDTLANDHYLKLTLENPAEVWVVENDLNQKFFTHILQVRINLKDFYIILICSHIDGEPSFVYYRTITSSLDLLEKYRRDARADAEDENEYVSEEGENLEVDQEFMDQIDFKKSILLAQMLERRNGDDIQLEEFIKYDSYMEPTLKDPDEIYEFLDDDGDTLHVCIKSFQHDKESFFYILFALPLKEKSSANSIVMIPILGFPSTDKDLYPQYAVGKRIDESLSN